MTELEQQIAKLPLHAPQQSLDDRIFAVLRTSCLEGSGTPVGSAAGPSISSTLNKPCESHAPRRGAVLVSNWILVCLSMSVGTFIGNSLPPLSPLNPDRHSVSDMSSSPHKDTGIPQRSTEQPIPASTIGENSEKLPAPFSVDSAMAASQIAESSPVSAAEAALDWEQKTGQIFNVLNHVNDRRFDMCRDCHRVGS